MTAYSTSNTPQSTPARAPRATPRFDTLVSLLRHRAEEQAGFEAYAYLNDGEDDETRLTYGELDRRARAIAALVASRVEKGARVLLLYPPGLDYVAGFFGVLYAGAVAVPAYPPDPMRLARTLPRLQAIAADCGASLVLSIAPIVQMADALLAGAPDLRAIEWCSTDDVELARASDWTPPDTRKDSLAFLQYTSGSTATPRGVMLTHGNLLANLALIHKCAGYSPETRSLTWVPPYHDMGLIGGILEPCFGGFFATLMSPVDFLRRPLRWLRAISRMRATTSAAPNFAFDLCVRRSTPEERASLDLRSWETVFNGAEPIHHETLDRFAEAFAVSGFRRETFYPCYGLAESTLIVSGGDRRAPPVLHRVRASSLRERIALQVHDERETDARILVGCGRALEGGTIAIVDPETMRSCPDGQVGEIWLGSPSVAQGYWARAEQTEATFGARIAGEAARGAFLRTGDLGFLHAGELFVTGRLKDLIILHGQNHYPQDLELVVERAHAALRVGCAAAFSVIAGREERLVVAVEAEKSAAAAMTPALAAELGETVAAALAREHAVQLFALALLAPGSIPKTSSGKIQRHATKAGFESSSLELVARWPG